MNWLAINSLEELKALGKFKDVKRDVQKSIGEVVNLKLNSWNNLYLSIEKFQNTLSILGLNTNEQDPHDKDERSEFFYSKSAEYIFYILELDGKARLKKLKVTRTHYSNKEKARKWRNDIAKLIHSDRCNHPRADEATSKLIELYEGMVGNEK